MFVKQLTHMLAGHVLLAMRKLTHTMALNTPHLRVGVQKDRQGEFG